MIKHHIISNRDAFPVIEVIAVTEAVIAFFFQENTDANCCNISIVLVEIKLAQSVAAEI